MPAPNLYLDPQIRDWVLFPITLVMVSRLILVGLLRIYVTQLLDGSPKKQPEAAVREQRALNQSQILRTTSTFSPLPPSSFQALSARLTEGFQNGDFLKTPLKRDENGNVIEDQSAGAPPNPLTDPGAMDGMMENMKKQAVMMVPNFAIMGWINFFFSGFLLIKLPFPLTHGFKSMLQRDIAAPDMDVRWVSALSWYFLNWFGLNGLFRYILHDPSAQIVDPRSTVNLAQVAGALPAGGAPPTGDFNKFFKQEAENLELAGGMYKWMGEGVEQKVLEKWAL
ncbi:Uncharacterized conserved protein [Phaffia rhodozyma]|uniref:ER membrane protein complex subunit 3 n=1 Tax=Phaffia rhodozyma TaxID=264483 RepID=A0A0F7SKW5_PHARH|nr:Uncharacterized conserved protein [Phaffia rhodozyma]